MVHHMQPRCALLTLTRWNSAPVKLPCRALSSPMCTAPDALPPAGRVTASSFTRLQCKGTKTLATMHYGSVQCAAGIMLKGAAKRFKLEARCVEQASHEKCHRTQPLLELLISCYLRIPRLVCA